LAINAVFPHRLARIAEEQGQRVVQISTDAVFPRDAGERDEAGVIGPEDFYGLSKAAGEISGSRALTIRCSLIGPPAEARSRGLWSWIASEAKGATVRGYTNQLWSGLTTLQLAEVCAALVDADAFGQVRRHGAIHHLAPNATLSKYEVVRILASVVRPDLKVAAADGPTDVRRVLVSRYGALDRLTPRYDDWDAAIAASFQEFKRQHEVC
jgi:dTDP-4-dehydrorhamnose reductase